MKDCICTQLHKRQYRQTRMFNMKMATRGEELEFKYCEECNIGTTNISEMINWDQYLSYHKELIEGRLWNL